MKTKTINYNNHRIFISKRNGRWLASYVPLHLVKRFNKRGAVIDHLIECGPKRTIPGSHDTLEIAANWARARIDMNINPAPTLERAEGRTDPTSLLFRGWCKQVAEQRKAQAGGVR